MIAPENENGYRWEPVRPACGVQLQITTSPGDPYEILIEAVADIEKSLSHLNRAAARMIAWRDAYQARKR